MASEPVPESLLAGIVREAAASLAHLYPAAGRPVIDRPPRLIEEPKPSNALWMCESKIRYGSKAAAVATLRELQGRRRGRRHEGCHAYHCPSCGAWHLGHGR
jgi:hypothetical protein